MVDENYNYTIGIIFSLVGTTIIGDRVASLFKGQRKKGTKRVIR